MYCQLLQDQLHYAADGPDQGIERGLATLHKARNDDSCLTESATSMISQYITMLFDRCVSHLLSREIEGFVCKHTVILPEPDPLTSITARFGYNSNCKLDIQGIR